MELDEARAVLAEQHHVVLATLRRDATPQMCRGGDCRWSGTGGREQPADRIQSPELAGPDREG
ncbi:MAG: hypothetical protein ACRDTH_13940 [Pseudonocardiaceae bacterium]